MVGNCFDLGFRVATVTVAKHKHRIVGATGHVDPSQQGAPSRGQMSQEAQFLAVEQSWSRTNWFRETVYAQCSPSRIEEKMPKSDCCTSRSMEKARLLENQKHNAANERLEIRLSSTHVEVVVSRSTRRISTRGPKGQKEPPNAKMSRTGFRMDQQMSDFQAGGSDKRI
ncbi:hypothetical protein MRB53_041133 [Persea americana]|nr:hypothetical protein MRB53_041133 [Persea americana]